ncbi:MAG: 50S ribosomal protein L6, partial [Nanoarchaeota archaeon]
KVCSGPPQSHFPMQVNCAGGVFTVKNFLGEKIARTVKVNQGANVKITGTEITVESPDIELAGKTASDIELLVRISDKDRRTFQDGIYITQKPGRND